MFKNKIAIETQDGICEAFEVYSQKSQGQPAILLYMDAFGVRDALLAIAEKFAVEGYFVLVPNLFYRDHTLPLTDYPETFTKEEIGTFFPTLKVYMAHLPPHKLIEDARFYLNHLKDHGPVKLVGYCFGGGHAVRTAAKYPELVSHVVSLHAGNLANDDENAPIKYLSEVKARLFFGHADHDSSMPLPLIEKFENELKKKHKDCISKIFKGAHHGFTMIDLPVYNREASEQSLKEAVGFFKT